MANSSRLSEIFKSEVYVVQMGNSPEEATDILKLAFEALDINDLKPSWITISDCIKKTEKELKVYVLDPFEGVAFEHLKTFNCRIVGPLCVLYCFQHSDILPKRSYPVYSASMRKITITSSNVSTEMRKEISSRVELMGGFFTADLTKSVSHLVVGAVGSPKYIAAVKSGISIMVPEWITDVWENGQHEQRHASDSYYNKYKCPVFKGLVITVSQLSSEERLAIKAVVEENGGSYSGALKAHETTHLILNECNGDKYRFAKNRNIICVKVSWIYDSVEAGYCKDGKLYALDTSVHTQQNRSTPKKDFTSIELPLVDCSVIAGHVAVSCLDETQKTDASVSISSTNNSYLALDEFNFSSVPKYGQFLEGCKIFLTGFNAFHMDKLRKIVNSGGGILFSKYSDSISHIVCGELSDDIFKRIKSSSVKMYVVNFKWLLECCKNEKLIDERPFSCMDWITFSPEKNKVPKEKVKLSKPELQNNLRISAKEEFKTDGVTSMLKQCMNAYEENNENEINKCEKGNGADVKNKSNNSELLPKIDDSENKVQSVETEPEASSSHLQENFNERNQVTVEKNDDPENDDENTTLFENGDENTSLFFGLKFVIIGFGEKDSKNISNIIATHSGRILNKPCNMCDIAIVPLIWNGFQIPVPNIVSYCWLKKCIEQSRICDFDENELFRPFALTNDKKPFESFVISFSQYAGIERDCLMHLAENLGATCQGYFVQKANVTKGVLPNTHLVVPTPDGSKYDASKKWNIPAVSKKWVIDAALMGVAPDVKNYLVEEFPEFLFDEDLTKVLKNAKTRSMLHKNIGNTDVFASANSNFSELENDNNQNISFRFRPEKKIFDEIKTIKSRNDSDSNNCMQRSRFQHNKDAKYSNDEENEKAILKSGESSIDVFNSDSNNCMQRSRCQHNKDAKVSNDEENEKTILKYEESSIDVFKTTDSEKYINLKNSVNTPLQNNRVAELCNRSRTLSISLSAKQGSDSSNGSFSFSLTPNFKFQISGILNELELDASSSPESFVESKNNSPPLVEMFSRNLVCALQRFDDKYNITECLDEKLFREKLCSDACFE